MNTPKDWKERFRDLIKSNHTEYCSAHSEGQYCHLDDDEENAENILPIIESFIESERRLAMEEERERMIKMLNLFSIDDSDVDNLTLSGYELVQFANKLLKEVRDKVKSALTHK